MTAIILDNAARVKRAVEWMKRSLVALDACMAIDDLDAVELEEVAVAIAAIAQDAHGAWFRRVLDDAGRHDLLAIVDSAAAAGTEAAEAGVAAIRRPRLVPPAASPYCPYCGSRVEPVPGELVDGLPAVWWCDVDRERVPAGEVVWRDAPAPASG